MRQLTRSCSAGGRSVLIVLTVRFRPPVMNFTITMRSSSFPFSSPHIELTGQLCVWSFFHFCSTGSTIVAISIHFDFYFNNRSAGFKYHLITRLSKNAVQGLHPRRHHRLCRGPFWPGRSSLGRNPGSLRLRQTRRSPDPRGPEPPASSSLAPTLVQR